MQELKVVQIWPLARKSAQGWSGPGLASARADGCTTHHMVAKDNRGGQLLARHRIRLVCLEPVLDGLSLESLPKDGLDRVSHQLGVHDPSHGRGAFQIFAIK